MQVPRCKYQIVAMATGLMFCHGQSALAEDVTADAVGKARAKGLVVLRAIFPPRGEVWRVSLLSSEDGERFTQAGIGALNRRLLWSVVDDGEFTTVFVPAIGSYGGDVSFFDGPGPHWVRWKIAFRDDSKPRTAEDQGAKDIQPAQIDQRLDVVEPCRSDLGFLSRLGEIERIKTLLGREWIEGRTEAAQKAMLASSLEAAEFRALAVVGELLEATRERVPWELSYARHGKTIESALIWADTLWALAQEFPDSSYAPYAASYAGCCYLAPVFEAYRSEKSNRRIGDKEMTRDEFGILVDVARAEGHLDDADAALAFAAEHGDAYLKPRALYYRVFAGWLGGDLEKCGSRLDAASTAARGETSLTRWIVEQREGLEKMRQRWSEAADRKTP